MSDQQILVFARDVGIVASHQGDQSASIDGCRDELYRAVAEDKLSTAGVERIYFRVIGAIDEAVTNNRGGPSAGGIVLLA